ncbi:SDR family oxidoreductase [Sphaerisporangium sp. NPDC088356]|uniref:SDR family oxidoreductase n=1 Tax=Sphaerisporangium sp. NPDC088356 TaxID=3154871 RepID=UPI00344855E2
MARETRDDTHGTTEQAGRGAKVALVTGASRGLGRAVARHLALAGHDIVVNFRRNDDFAAEAVKEIEGLGARAIAVKADLEDVAQIDTMFDQVAAEFGGLDVLVSNAAATAFKPLLELSDSNVQRTLRLTVNGFIRCVQRAAPLMEGRGGRVIGVSGVDSLRYMPGHGLLGAAKAALESLIRAFAIELGPLGITVNGVSPGGFETDSSRIYGGSQYEFLKERFTSQSGVKDFGTVDDMAAVIAFLATPQARYLTGQTIIVDGGVSANLGDLDPINSAVRLHEKGRALA